MLPVSPAVASEKRALPSLVAVLVFLWAHVALAGALQATYVATAHAVVTVIGVLLVCLLARETLSFVLAAAYVMGCDVLWRMTGASVPWELGKFLLIGLAVVALVRLVRPRGLALPFLLLALLVPGALIAVDRLGLDAARDPLSFNLAGPVALAAWWSLTRNLTASRGALIEVLWVALGPILTVNAFAWAAAQELGPTDFQPGASTIAATAGFGPNQVAGLLGLGVLFSAFLIALDRRLLLRVLAGGLLVWFVIEAGLSFSRGGLLAVAVGGVLALPHFLTGKRQAMRVIVVVLVGYLMAVMAVLPILQGMSGNKFGARFTDFNSTLRTQAASADLRLFADEPLLGVGVGQSPERRELDTRIASHTEFARLPAEHGMFGLAALIALMAMAVTAYRRQRGPLPRAWAIALLGWTMVTMGSSATRFAAIAFAFGLAALRFDSSDDSVVLSEIAPSDRSPEPNGMPTGVDVGFRRPRG